MDCNSDDSELVILRRIAEFASDLLFAEKNPDFASFAGNSVSECRESLQNAILELEEYHSESGELYSGN